MTATATATAVDTTVDLVNAALLGTERRPVPVPGDVDAGRWLLEAAARRRVVTLVAAGTTTAAPPSPAPAATLPHPPPAARAVLDEILLVTGSEPVNLWLREALDAGVGLAPEHWTPVLDRARRATDLDRRRLGTALGPPGRWFARHNPAWAGVVRSVETAASGEPADPTFTAAEAGRALEALVAPGQQAGGARALGRRLAARLPLDTYAALARFLAAPADDPARAGLAAAEEVLRLRLHLAATFDPERRP